MGSEEKVARNRAIVAMREAGATYRAIAAQFRLSLQRVEAIVEREKRRKEEK